MTAPRMPLMQRKGPPPAAMPSPAPAIPSGPADNEGAEAQPIQCQGCGAMIDPTSGAVVAPPDAGPADQGAGGDVSSKLSAMLGSG